MSSALKYTCDRCGKYDILWNQVYSVTFRFAAGPLREDGFAKKDQNDVNKELLPKLF